jgi:hypothetical protein
VAWSLPVADAVAAGRWHLSEERPMREARKASHPINLLLVSVLAAGP